ncbi:prolipoprotein diacylglyceryl transferase [Roseofilum sp. BLCC_M143]|uniref:Phosphatidylglycerol--prolipoprotein diacylglyceryl transferase n=1 Tax=Roseofilum casamattae BLCC-M143 TaxID=3022442 RepID=A0ABT7C1G2_9CYAN|nr:prolipoprotein diacylglyceryl transferase [Roseofilum casamattae]MDJ1184521.1 prolipoprotein diacylglyceryl transferase [Roseofilum casamattae BLCC-M143]
MIDVGTGFGTLIVPLGLQFASPGPIIFEIGPLAIRWYGLLIASAVLLGVTLSQYLAQRRGLNPDAIGDLAIWLVLGAIPGARIYYILFQWENYSDNLGEMFAIWKGGIAIHGAILGGMLAALIFARLNRLSFWKLADVVAPSLILGQAIGRWGNFFNSEAFGSPTDLPWKLFIPINRRPIEYIQFDYFHPTFLYESLWNLMVLGILLGLFVWGLKHKPGLKSGTLFMVYLIAYSLGRVWIEALRTDSLMLGDIRVAQLVSLAAISLGVLGLVWLYAFDRSLPDVVSPSSSDRSLS